jgi:hypothetical protein
MRVCCCWMNVGGRGRTLGRMSVCYKLGSSQAPDNLTKRPAAETSWEAEDIDQEILGGTKYWDVSRGEEMNEHVVFLLGMYRLRYEWDWHRGRHWSRYYRGARPAGIIPSRMIVTLRTSRSERSAQYGRTADCSGTWLSRSSTVLPFAGYNPVTCTGIALNAPSRQLASPKYAFGRRCC